MPIETDALRKATPSDGGAARTIVAGPDQEVDQLVLVLLSAINLARHSVKIATPYFLPDEQLVTALQLALYAAVEVDLVLPAFNNQRLVAWAAKTHVKRLLQTGQTGADRADRVSSLAGSSTVRPYEADDD